MDIRKFLKTVRDKLFPQNITCDLCGAEIFDGGHFCGRCAPTVEFNDKTVCPVCGRRTARPEICTECKADAPKFKKAASALIYSDGGAKLVLKFKNGASYLKEYLGTLMAEKAKTLPACDCVTFVPITKKRRRERGYNQGELLAEVLSEKLGIPVVSPLEKKRETAEQKGLTKAERLQNLKACYKIRDKSCVKDKTVLLADDVLTTGATADEACRELTIAGAKAVYLVTAASVEYKQNESKKHEDKK